jgi:hypothetical protein
MDQPPEKNNYRLWADDRISGERARHLAIVEGGQQTVLSDAEAFAFVPVEILEAIFARAMSDIKRGKASISIMRLTAPDKSWLILGHYGFDVSRNGLVVVEFIGAPAEVAGPLQCLLLATVAGATGREIARKGLS